MSSAPGRQARRRQICWPYAPASRAWTRTGHFWRCGVGSRRSGIPYRYRRSSGAVQKVRDNRSCRAAHPLGTKLTGPACRCAVHDNQCKWYPGAPLEPRHPEWGSGFLSENYQDSQYGDDPHQTCEHLVLEGDDAGNSYTCERDFCETCGERAGKCDAFCGFCRSMADPVRGDFPGTECVSALVEEVELYRAHCTTCVTDEVTHCTPICGEVTFTPPCDMCLDDSGFGSNDCAHLVSIGVSCTRDLGVVASAFAGVLLQDRCQVTCGICECPPEQTVNCNSDIVQGGLMPAVLGDCYGQESSAVRAGYAPFLQCAREAAASCEPLDCMNLYYDVRDACFGAEPGQRCGFPAPVSTPGDCEYTIAMMVQHADSCVGLAPDPYTGHVSLGVVADRQTLPQVAAQTRAACLGCDLSALYEACGRPDWYDLQYGTQVWETCSPACGAVAVPFFINFQSQSQCAGLWEEAGLQSEALGGIPGAIEALYNVCNVDCEGVHHPYLGGFGTCNSDGTLSQGQSCELVCDSAAAELHGAQPFCAPGGHLVVAGTENGALTPWEAGSCGCNHGEYQQMSGASSHTCVPCNDCIPGKVRVEECGYTHPGGGGRIFTGESDTQCVTCQRHEMMPSRYANHNTHACEPCTVCSAQFPQVHACTYEQDTQCARTCASIPVPADGNLGSCVEGAMAYDATCELACNAGTLADPDANYQPQCGSNGRLIRQGSVNTYHPLGIDWTAGVDFRCVPCVDEPVLIMGRDCASWASAHGCGQPYMDPHTYRPDGHIRDHCPLSCDMCTPAPPPPGVEPPPPPPPPLTGACIGSNCQNGGTCHATGRTRYSCICAPGFNGRDCETNIDDCTDSTTFRNPCLHGGVCTDGVSDYTCACPEGITGDNCEYAPPPPPPTGCALMPCQNGGVCDETGSRWSCVCAVSIAATVSPWSCQIHSASADPKAACLCRLDLMATLAKTTSTCVLLPRAWCVA